MGLKNLATNSKIRDILQEALNGLSQMKAPDKLTASEAYLMGKGHKIEAIKDYRYRTGSSLREAKDAVELWASKLWASKQIF